MERGNVLVIGNSGVGKSTLINAVCGKDVTETSWGTKGTTRHLKIYESERTPFRMIDTVGFEPGFLKEFQAIQAVKGWSKQSMKNGNEDRQIHAIWFCVDGTATKLFPKTIKNILKATRIYKSIPIIVVITKSYSVPDRKNNIEMVNKAFAEQKMQFKEVIPVIASTYVLTDTSYVAPEGITQLIDSTNNLMPEGMKAAQKDIYRFKLNRIRAMSHSVVVVSTAAAVIVGAVPLPLADAVILSSIELGEINAVAKIYNISQNEESKRFINSIVEVGTVSVAAKAAISALKAIPGVNLGASVINAIIAGSIVAAIGEGAIYAFEQIYLGNKTVNDIDWIKKVMEVRLDNEFIAKVTCILESMTENMNQKEIVEKILSIFSDKSKGKAKQN